MKIKKIFSDEHLVFQEGGFNCGPVTLLNILHLKGDFSHTEDELSQLCEAKPVIGTKEEDMVKSAEQLGLEIVEEKRDATLADIERHIDNGDFVVVCYFHAFAQAGHYGLVSEYDEAAFYFRDCSLGFLRLKKEYLKKYWYGTDKTIKGWFMAVK
ncbi:MAG TPA: C39 family peptidase [Candidatus Dormibacteraeota bacterium]|nr:C39 family peptidase [Candidatus Dormibacteraeota bacterium]